MVYEFIDNSLQILYAGLFDDITVSLKVMTPF